MRGCADLEEHVVGHDIAGALVLLASGAVPPGVQQLQAVQLGAGPRW